MGESYANSDKDVAFPAGNSESTPAFHLHSTSVGAVTLKKYLQKCKTFSKNVTLALSDIFAIKTDK